MHIKAFFYQNIDMNTTNTRSNQNYKRLKIFCLFFAALAVYFGLMSSFAREKYALDEQNRLNKGMNELASYLGQISDSLYADDYHAIALISGGAKVVISNLPLAMTTRDSLQSFFHNISTLTENEKQKIIIESYAYYAKKISNEILNLQSDNGLFFADDVRSLRIESPPYFAKEDDNTVFEQSTYNYGESIAKEKARRYLGNMTIIHRSDPNSLIVRYSNGSAFADVSKNSGALIRYCAAGVIGDGILSFDSSDAIQNARDFLESLCIRGIELSSFSTSNDRLNAIFKKNGKFIRISVSLENGKVVTFDASDYYLTK